MSEPELTLPPPVADIEACRVSHEKLHDAVRGLGDEVMRRATLLPGWSVGHVLTHLARNADSVRRRLDAALDGRLVDPYEGGAAGRAAEIEAGAPRPAAEIVADLIATDDALDAEFRAAPDTVWGRTIRAAGGVEGPATTMVFARWREVETHLVDLGLGYTPEEWPDGLDDRWLPEVVGGLVDRADPKALLAWALGRGATPDLKPWG